MLFNPKWTKPEIYSLEGLIAWLETKPSDETYDWFDIKSCLVSQYLQSHGLSIPEASRTLDRMFIGIPEYQFVGFGPSNRQSLYLDPINDADRTTRHTFGAALIRAKAALANRG